MANVAKDFRAFLLRGNVVELAVAVVIGAAFGAVVTAFVTSIVMPIVVAIIGGDPGFGLLAFSIGDTIVPYGDFLNALIAFVMIAAAVYFLVVVPVNALTARRQAVRDRMERETEADTRDCPECLSEIPAAARRCAFCTAQLAAAV